MIVFYMSFVFLFAREAKSAYATDFGNLNSPSRNSNSFKRTTIKSGELEAQSACHNECLALAAEIKDIYKVYSDNKAIKYLYYKCGTVTEGKYSTETNPPICWCNTPKEFKEQRSITLSICRHGIQIMRTYSNALTTASIKTLANITKKRTNYQKMDGEVEKVGMYEAVFQPPTRPRSGRPRRPNTRCCFGVCGTSRTNSPLLEGENRNFPHGRPNTSLGAGPSSAGPSVPPLPPQQEEDWNARNDGEREGFSLVTDVRVLGMDVRALLDTGSDFSLIHPTLAGVLESTGDVDLFSADSQYEVFGKTKITLQIKPGVNVLLTGYVTDRKFGILLGGDFFGAYAAKINIPGRKMEIFSGVTMTIKFRAAPAGLNMMTGRQVEYSALQISAHVNDIDTKIIIDTGSSLTIVNKYLVNQEDLRPVATKYSVGGSAPVAFKGATSINLQIGSKSLTIRALVPEFTPPANILTGNDFNKQYVELIDYPSKSVSLRFPDSSKLTVPAFVIKGE